MPVLEHRSADLTCPSCGETLSYQDGLLRCPACSETIPVVDGIPRFPVATDQPSSPGFFDALSSIYETPLWFPPIYRVIGGPFAPLDDRAFIAELLAPLDGDLLDVACGTGRFTRYIASEVGFVWGIDLSEGMLKRARRYADRDGVTNVQFARMSVDDLRFESGFFDSAACCWALHLFPDIPRALREVQRVLKPDGRFVGATLGKGYLLAIPGTQAVLGQTIGARVFERQELRDLLLDSGFERIGIEIRGAAMFFSARKHN